MLAAIEVGEVLGVDASAPALLQETNNTVVWLRPSPVVAKVATRADAKLDLRLGHARLKSVAELGVIGHAEDMHCIMDGERGATLAYLDDLTRRIGGRRGEAAVRTPTEGLIYAVTRHATSRGARDATRREGAISGGLGSLARTRPERVCRGRRS